MNKWPKQSQCTNLFGNPSHAGWASRNLVPIATPFQMHMDTIPIHAIQINKIAADSLTRVLTSIWNQCDHNQTKVGQCHCDIFSGSFAVRPIRGGTAPSMHSFGLAIDIDAPHNPLAAPVSKTVFKPDSLVVKAFKDEDWIWGGDWKGRRDAMHFQAAIVG